MIKENIRIINHLFDEVFKARNMQIIDELVAEEVINHEVTGIDRTPGLEGFRREIKLFLDAFPNAAISAEDIVAQNDKVVVRWRLQGNHGGSLLESRQLVDMLMLSESLFTDLRIERLRNIGDYLISMV
jgi:predicted ester cyclase